MIKQLYLFRVRLIFLNQDFEGITGRRSISDKPRLMKIIKVREIMETRVAVMAIIVEEAESVEKLNSTLHEFSQYVIGRMGIPYREKKISIVSVALDAPQDVISSLAGKLGNIEGLSVKTAYSNVIG